MALVGACMNLERTGPRIHPDYASALGLAVYSFAASSGPRLLL
jgi:hypothetical protein